MGLQRINYTPALIARLMASGAYSEAPMRVADVGCAGGIEAHWRVFSPHLRAIGFDPMLAEVARLNDAEQDAGVHYVDAFIKQPGWPADTNEGSNLFFHRSSTARASAVQAERSEHVVNGWQRQALTDRTATLDELLQDFGPVDFLKSDTDGGELEVLSSGPETLRGLLGASVEANIPGGLGPQSNTRSNIDQLMRGAGFSLFDEWTYRYSRKALPDRFSWKAVGDTRRGQVLFSQCLYMRDVVGTGQETTPAEVLKLASIFELVGLNDCAAELIQDRREQFAVYMDPDEALDVLTAEWWPGRCHDELQAAFDRDYTAFYAEHEDYTWPVWYGA